MAARQLKSARSAGRKAGRFVADDTVELLEPTRVRSPLARWGPMITVALASFVSYIPAIDNGFVTWDDDHYIYDNRQVSEPDGLRSIWGDVMNYSDPRFQRTFDKRVSHQYYPLVFSMFWLEYRLFGGDDSEKVIDARGIQRSKTLEEHIDDGQMSAKGFHIVNMVLHALAGVILIAMFRCLGVSNWVAWAAAILFGVHPMQASSVAWTAEVKNVLSLIFYMLAMMAYVKHRRTRNGGFWVHWGFYVLALLGFQAALFSKTVALTLPVMLFFTDRLLEKCWNWKLMQKSALRVAPFLVLSLVAALTTMKVEDRQRTIPITDAQRPLVAGAVLLFYPAKMLVPINQSPIYPLWKPDLADVTWYLPLMGSMVIAGLIFRFRRVLGPHFIWAVLLYFVTEIPMLGFKNINYFQFAFVADHYFYHGSVALFLMLALGLDFARRAIKPPRVGWATMTGVVVAAAAALGARTWYYSDYFQTADTFWQRVIAMNPRCWPAYYNTANARFREANQARKKGDRKRAAELADFAVKYYEKVAELHHQIRQPFDQLMKVEQWRGDYAKALYYADRAIQRFSGVPDFYKKACEFASRARMDTEALDRCARAATLYQRTWRQGKSRKPIADCRLYASVSAANLGKWKVSYDQAIEASKQYKLDEKRGGQAKAHLAAATAAIKLERFADAENHATQAADVFAQTDQPRQAVQAYRLAAEAARRQHRREQADTFARSALQICTASAKRALGAGQPDKAGQALMQGANIAREAGWSDQVADLYRQAADRFIEAGDRLTNRDKMCDAARMYGIAANACAQMLKINPANTEARQCEQDVRPMLEQARSLCNQSRP